MIIKLVNIVRSLSNYSGIGKEVLESHFLQIQQMPLVYLERLTKYATQNRVSGVKRELKER